MTRMRNKGRWINGDEDEGKMKRRKNEEKEKDGMRG